MTKFGTAGAETKECILTGRRVDVFNSHRYHVEGTPYHYRVLSSQQHRITPEMQEEWAKEARGMMKSGAVSEVAVTRPQKTDKSKESDS